MKIIILFATQFRDVGILSFYKKNDEILEIIVDERING